MSLSLSVAPTNLESLESDVLVVGVYAGEESPRLAPCALSQETVEGINELLGGQLRHSGRSFLKNGSCTVVSALVSTGSVCLCGCG